MYYLSDVAEFARKKGSKDKKKRQYLNTVLSRAALGTAIGGTLGTAEEYTLSKGAAKLGKIPRVNYSNVAKVGAKTALKGGALGLGFGAALAGYSMLRDKLNKDKTNN